MSKMADIGMVGLAVMGSNLAKNMESRGYTVAVYNRDQTKLSNFMTANGNKKFISSNNYKDFCNTLNSPRKIMLMVKAGAPVDSVIEELLPYLSKGDIIIDGGNSFFIDTIRRTEYLKSKGIQFIGCGVSGGEEGALKGPSLMPGGSPEAWTHIKKIFQDISAKASDGAPCCECMGENGAGHFVKMVHNGIEYGDMQMITEAYYLMKNLLGMSNLEIHETFKGWKTSELDSYLIDITSDILKEKDPTTGKYILDSILDVAGQKGTGKWTSESGLDLGAAIPTISEAVFARCLSALKDERVAASKAFTKQINNLSIDKTAFINHIKDALYASKICSYAQGFHLLKLAAKEHNWEFDFASIALIWRGGCIIRAKFLQNIADAFKKNNSLNNLLLDPFFINAIKKSENGWRKIVSKAVESAVAIPTFSSALTYFDAYTSEQLPANLIQAQRDYFGAHTYERVDKPRGEFFHTDWDHLGGNVTSSSYNV